MTGIERERVGRLPIWGWSIVTALMVWSLYVLTLGPTTAFWDTSEYIATAYILGLPHPPGNPLFVVLGRVWIVLLDWTGLSVATRVNLLSATASAAASAFWFLAVARIWARFSSRRVHVLVASTVSTVLGATAFTVWAQSNVNAKVYTVSLFFVALISYLAMVWQDRHGTVGGRRLVLLIAFLLGLGATNHQMSILPIPALLLLMLLSDWRTLLRPRLMGPALALAAVGFSLQIVFVPIRSARNPVIDEADPQCEPLTTAFIPKIRDGHLGVKCEALNSSLSREQYQKPPLLPRQSKFSAQLANYGEYLDWQWARSLQRGPRMFITLLFLGLAVWGFARHRKGDPAGFAYLFSFLITLTLLLVFYLNFKYGYSQHPEVALNLHEVRERDYFYTLSFSVWGLYAGFGLMSLWQRIAGWIGEYSGREGRASLLASPVLAIGLIPLVLNFPLADRRDDYSARDWAYNMLQSVEPYGVLFTNGDNDTFPLWYVQEVEGIRRDVTVIVQSYLGTKWYPKQLRQLTAPCAEGVDPLATPTVVVCQRPFDLAAAVEPYRHMKIVPPTRSILALTDEQIDRTPLYDVLPRDLRVAFSDAVTVDLPKGKVVTFPDLMVYSIARESLGDRPVYFATTAPPVYQEWNLEPHLLRQGLAYKLADGLLESTADTVQLPEQWFGVRWVDMARTHALLWDVFQLDYLLDWKLWPEPSTRASIPAQYYVAHTALGEAERMREEPERANEDYARGRRLLELSQRGVP